MDMLLKRIGAFLLAMVLVVTTFNLGVFASTTHYAAVSVNNQGSTDNTKKTLKVLIHLEQITQNPAQTFEWKYKNNQDPGNVTIRVNDSYRVGENIYLIYKVGNQTVNYFNYTIKDVKINDNSTKTIHVILKKNDNYKLVNTNTPQDNVGGSKLLRVYFYDNNGNEITKVDKYFHNTQPGNTSITAPNGYLITKYSYGQFSNIRDHENGLTDILLQEPQNEITIDNDLKLSKPKYVIKVYCHKLANYTVKYYLEPYGGGSYPSPITSVKSGPINYTIEAPEMDNLESYYVLDPQKHPNSKMPTGKITSDGKLELKVYYKLKRYSVTFLTGDKGFIEGTNKTKKEFNDIPHGKNFNSFITVPEVDVTKDNFIWVGWKGLPKPDDFDIIENLTFEAEYQMKTTEPEKATYIIKYYFEQLEGDDLHDPQKHVVTKEAEKGTEVKAVNFSPLSSAYTAFQENELPTGENKGDLELIVRYPLNIYTVTFDAGEYGEIIEEDEFTGIKHGEKFSPARSVPDVQVTNNDYVFEGWYTKDEEGNWSESPFNPSTPITQNITLYARWKDEGQEPGDDDEVFENVYVSNEYYLNNGLKFASGREYLTARRGNGTISFNVPSTSTHDGKTYQLKGIKLYEIINKAYRSFAIETEIPTDTTTSTGLETTTTGGTTGTLTSNGLELTTTGNPTDTLTSNGLELTTTGNPTDTLTSTGTEPTATGDPTNSTTTSSTDSTFSAADTTQPSTNVDTEGSGDDSQETTTEGEPSTPEKLFDALAESSPPEELDLKYENGNVTAPFTLTFDYDEEKEYLVVIAYSLTEDDKGHTDYDDSDDSEPFSLGWDGTVVHLSDLGTLPKTGGSSKKMAGLSAIVLLTGAALKTLRFRRKGQNNGEGQFDDQE